MVKGEVGAKQCLFVHLHYSLQQKLSRPGVPEGHPHHENAQRHAGARRGLGHAGARVQSSTWSRVSVLGTTSRTYLEHGSCPPVSLSVQLCTHMWTLHVSRACGCGHAHLWVHVNESCLIPVRCLSYTRF